MISAEDLIHENQEPNAMRLGTVAALFAHGTAKVQFDGEDSPSEKEYAYLSYYTPQVNDRVLLSKFGKTYVILGALSYAVAPPIIDEGNNYLFDEEEVVMTKGLDVTGATKLKSGLAVTGNMTATGNIEANGNLSGVAASISNEISANGVSTTGTAAGNNSMRTGTINVTTANITNLTVYGTTSSTTVVASNILRHTGGSLGFFNAAAQTKKWVTWNNQTDSQKINNLAYALRDYGLITLN